MRKLRTLFCLSVFLTLCDSAKILGLFTSPSPSHIIIHMSIAKALIEQGHELTVVTIKPLKEKAHNFRHIQLTSTNDDQDILKIKMENVIQEESSIKKFTLGFDVFFHMIHNQYGAMRDPELRDLLKNEKFDLLILGYLFNDFQLAIAAQLKVPVIISWVVGPMGPIPGLAGNPSESSYVPNMFSVLKQPMNFFEKVVNILSNGLLYSVKHLVNHFSRQYYDEYAQEFNLKDIPSFEEMRKNVSLVFCNSHFSEGPIRPNVPAIVEIGGIQIKDKPDPLEPKLKQFLDNSKDGAILFSFGSNVKISNLDPKIIKVFYNVFSKLKQNILWKWENSDPVSFPGNSKNIFFSSWIPQDDVLAHKNMKLFVTHGGKGSVAESQYHGVPLIGLPIFGDQPGNIDKVVDKGYGLKLNYKTVTEEELEAAVFEILKNRSYVDNINRFVDTYKDRPLSAKESVVYWTEYVIRHHGAPHLQSPLVHMNLIEQYNIDVFAFIFGVLFIIYKLFKFIFRLICKCGRKKVTLKKKEE